MSRSADFVDQLSARSPTPLPAQRALLLQLGDFDIDLGDALLAVDAEIAVAHKRRLLAFAGRDRDARVLDHRRHRALADRDARAGRVEQAHGFVGQLAGRNIAVRQVDGGDDGGIGNAHLVMLLHRAENAAQHDRSSAHIGLADLDRLEPPRQRRVLFDILAVFRPGRGGDGAQRAACQRRLEQIGGIAGAGRAAGADQGVGLVDEQDDRASARLAPRR